MIAITSDNGKLLHWITSTQDTIGFHRLFGFTDLRGYRSRSRIRKRHGLSTARDGWHFQFSVDDEGHGLRVSADSGCEAVIDTNGVWRIITALGNFRLLDTGSIDDKRMNLETSSSPVSARRRPAIAIVAAVVTVLSMLLWQTLSTPMPQPEPQAPPISVKVIEPVRSVSIPPTVRVVQPLTLKSQTVTPGKKGGAAVMQNLGFLSLLGKKDLRSAIGGVSATAPVRTAGAGAGGPGGSGGEVLAGLGEGLKPITVGNTGVKGLGGVGGKKGAGGGLGGYGTGWVGSGGSGNSLSGIGDGKGFSSLGLSKDMVLEGGLDRGVVQATIAKYLSQVRACYEQGLRKQPGLSGQVSVQFEIAPSGRLNYSKVEKSSLGDVRVERCIADIMMSWLFPKPLGGVHVKVSYPFLLRPVQS